MGGLYMPDGRFADFAELAQAKKQLADEIATRQKAWDWTGTMGLLPDPDPVLRKLGESDAILESLTSDAHLCSVIQSRKLGTLKKEYSFQPGTEKDGAKPGRAAKRLCEQLTADLENIDLYSLISAILDAPLYGMAPVEIIWKPDNGRLAIADLIPRPARWFSFNEQNQPRFVSLYNTWTGDELPYGKFVIARHFPTYDNPFGLRLLSRCFWPVTFKKGGMKFWTILAEKYGMPFLIGKYAPGTTEAERQTMLTSLSSMIRDAVAVVPDGGAVELLQQTGNSSNGIHKELIAAMDAEISKVIVGQTMTTEDGSSLGQAKVHQEILEDFRQGDQHLVKTVMEEIAWLYMQINAPGIPCPTFNWFEEDDPQTALAERDKVLTDSGLKLSKSYYQKTYRLEDDDVEEEPESPALEAGGLKPEKTEAEPAFSSVENRLAMELMIADLRKEQQTPAQFAAQPEPQPINVNVEGSTHNVTTPDVKVDVAPPAINLTVPPMDLTPIAEMIKAMMPPAQPVEPVPAPEQQPAVWRFDVKRDEAGLITDVVAVKEVA